MSSGVQQGLGSWRFWAPVALIALGIAWIFWPALYGDWMWDDYIDIPQNIVTRADNGLWQIWFQPGSQLDYYPVKASVQWFQWRIFGNNTLGYHLTNLILHFINSLLVWRLLSRIGLRLAWIGGLLFAIHPVMVESVAWIAELKNTLSLPTFLMAMLFWIEYDEQGRTRDYLASFGLFAIALLTKPTMIMFPVVILLHAWWRRAKIGRQDIKGVIPFFVLSLLIGLLTLSIGDWFRQIHEEAPQVAPSMGILSKVELIGLASIFYLSKAVFPVDLMPLYPHWVVDPPQWFLFWPWWVFGVSFVLISLRRETWGRHVLFGLGFFFIMLAPFVSVTSTGFSRLTWVMDHFLYLSIIGIIGLAVAGLDVIWQSRLAQVRYGVAALGVAICLIFAVGSREYAAHFANEEELWSYTVERNPNAWLAHNNLGNLLLKRGQLLDAFTHIKEALRLNPGYAEAQNNMGVLLVRTQHYDEAIRYFREAIRLLPTYSDAHYNWGIAMVYAGHPAEAVAQFAEAARLRPDNSMAFNNWGVALMQTNQATAAREKFAEALRLDPTNDSARDNLRKIDAGPAGTPAR